VVEPAAPVVESVDAPSSAAVGENVTFTVTYRNEARVPGDLTVPFSLDGESVATRTVTVPAESSIERTYSVSFGSAGEHTIGVGETTRTITITGEETTAASASASEEEGVATPIPGFGVPAVVLALALVLVGTRTRHH
jgi:CARDB.